MGIDPQSRTPPPPGTLLELEVTGLSASGEGVGRVGGWVIFVPRTVPGDIARVRVSHRGKRFGRAGLEEVIRASASRRDPPCPHQAACGGCPLMVLDPAEGLRLKLEQLQQVLTRVGGIDRPVDRAISSPLSLGYRGRVRFALDLRGRSPRLGFRPPGRGEGLVAVDRCLLAPPRASELAHMILEQSWESGSGNRARGAPTHLEIRYSHAEDRYLAVWHTPPGPAGGMAAAAGRTLTEAEDLAGICRLATGSGADPRLTVLAGKDRLRERIGGFEVDYRATGFLQVNPLCAARLYRRAGAGLAPEGRAPRRLLDLYCGVGLIGLHAATPETECLGVEVDAGSLRAAARAARRAGLPSFRFLRSDVERALAELTARGERYEAVALNPPRQGAGETVPEAIRRLGARRVVVVSCHPAALARDLRRLLSIGFELTDVTAVDMFPQTAHLEVVASLSGGGGP